MFQNRDKNGTTCKYTYIQHKQDPLPSQLVIFLIQDFLVQNLELPSVERIRNSYSRVRLPVRGDNPRALAYHTGGQTGYNYFKSPTMYISLDNAYYWSIAPQMEHRFSFLKFYMKVSSP